MSSRSVSRVIFDTNTVLSALVFTNSRLAWLRSHWAGGHCVLLVSRTTVAELARVFAYHKFKLNVERRSELLGDYLPFCELIEKLGKCSIICRDVKDHMFLDLAHSSKADILVTGDQDLLVLNTSAPFVIETPEAYRVRML